MTTSGSIRTKLVRSEKVAERTMAFHFAKPAGFEFRAGQAIDVTLLNPPEMDGEGNTRTFSLTSADFENELTVATRVRDTAFKRVLSKASPGLEVEIAPPSGSFTLRRKPEKTAVLIAGGIGITPFFCMIKQAAHGHPEHKIWLFYSNRRPEDAAFLDALTALAQQNPNFRLVATMTQMEKSKVAWKGETGFINGEMLKRHLPSLEGSIYYIAGPPAMVTAMRGVLTGADVDEDDIRTEEFSGY